MDNAALALVERQAKEEGYLESRDVVRRLTGELMDHYGSAMERLDRGPDKTPAYSRSTPLIPLGEVTPSAYGFVQVVAYYGRKAPEGSRVRGWARRLNTWVATSKVASVNIKLYTGNADGEWLRDTEDDLGMPDSWPDLQSNMAPSQELSMRLENIATTIEALELLTRDINVTVE